MALYGLYLELTEYSIIYNRRYNVLLGELTMVKIKSQAEIASNFVDSIPRVAAPYKKGVQNTTDWQEKAIAGQSLYEAKMQDASVLARRGKAIANVSNADWQNKAVKLGAARIGPGMLENADKRTKNYEPVRQAIEGVTLPERTADPMANIDARVKPMVQAMMDAKKARLG